MWIKIFQLKRPFISLLNLLFYSHHAMHRQCVRDEFYSRVYDICIQSSLKWRHFVQEGSNRTHL